MSKDIDRFVAWIFQLHLQKFVAFCCTRPTTVSTTSLVSMPGPFHCTCRSWSSFGSPWTSSWPWNGGVKGPGTSSWPWKGGFEHPVKVKLALERWLRGNNCKKTRRKQNQLPGEGGEETTAKKQKESEINCRARWGGGNIYKKTERKQNQLPGEGAGRKQPPKNGRRQNQLPGA